MNLKLKCPECGEAQTISVDYRPARSAPPCSNPDSPAFSDSGDPGECETTDTCQQCGFDFGHERYMETLYELAEEEAQALYEDAMEARAEARRDK